MQAREWFLGIDAESLGFGFFSVGAGGRVALVDDKEILGGLVFGDGGFGLAVFAGGRMIV